VLEDDEDSLEVVEDEVVVVPPPQMCDRFRLPSLTTSDDASRSVSSPVMIAQCRTGPLFL
jgi:hypothetical protein